MTITEDFLDKVSVSNTSLRNLYNNLTDTYGEPSLTEENGDDVSYTWLDTPDRIELISLSYTYIEGGYSCISLCFMG